jgi:hypothetical protein
MTRIGTRAIAAYALQHVGRLLRLPIVEAVQVLVGEQQPGLRCQRPGELEFLQGGRAQSKSVGGCVARQPDEAQSLLGLTPTGVAVLAEPGRQGDVLEQREISQRARDLIGAADAPVADAIGRRRTISAPANVIEPVVGR